MMETTTKKKPKRGRPSAQDLLRRKLEALGELSPVATAEEVNEYVRRLVEVLKGD